MRRNVTMLLKFDPKGLDWVLLNEEQRTSIEQYNNIFHAWHIYLLFHQFHLFEKNSQDFFYGGTQYNFHLKIKWKRREGMQSRESDTRSGYYSVFNFKRLDIQLGRQFRNRGSR